MGTISIGLANSGVVNGRRDYNISDEHVSRLIAAYRDELHTLPVDATDAQVLAAWADDIIARAKERVTEFETTPPAPIDIAPE